MIDLTRTIAMGAAFVLCALWVPLLCVRAVSLWRVARLEADDAPAPPRWPSLSIIVPACNEANAIGAALRSLRGQTYPALEIVLVDDRSTDGTGAAMEAAREGDPRVRAVRVDGVPAGWLGKVHAQAVGLSLAQGELVLFADADVHMAPGLCERAVAALLHHELVGLTLLPRFVPSGLLVDVMMAGFSDGYIERLRGHAQVALPARGPIFGFGAFQLCQRAALERGEGLTFGRMDIADDLALGLALRAQGTTGFYVAPTLLSLTFYPTLIAALRGWERSAFGILAGFSLTRALVMITLLPLFSLAPLVVVLLARDARTLALPAVVAALLIVCALIGARRLARSVVAGALAPLGTLVLAGALALSTARCLAQGGVKWRDTTYPLARLRAGRRSWWP